MKIFVILSVLFVVCSLFSLANAQSGCIGCGGQYNPVSSSTAPIDPPQPAKKYVPGWANYGDGGNGCYWCEDPYTWGQNCVPLPRYHWSDCSATAECTHADVPSLKMLAAPMGSVNQAACKLVAPKWFYYNITSWTLLKCGCSNGYVGRDDQPSIRSKKLSLTDDEFKILSEKYPEAKKSVEAKKSTLGSRQDCFTSRLCDPSVPWNNCSNATNCPAPDPISCYSIVGSNSTCPGYLASPYGSNSCPMQEGPVCGLCNGAPSNNKMCTGKLYEFTQCPGHGLCLECHVIQLNNGPPICGAHMARSQSQCFCSSQQYYSRQGESWYGMCSGWENSGGYATWRSNEHKQMIKDARRSGGHFDDERSQEFKERYDSSTTAATTSSSTMSTVSGSSASSTTTGPNGTTTSTTYNQAQGDIVYGVSMCAPWASDIITMQCIVGNGNSGTVATVADCEAGRAIVPTGCPDTYHCGGHICGTLYPSNYDHWPTWTDLYPNGF